MLAQAGLSYSDAIVARTAGAADLIGAGAHARRLAPGTPRRRPRGARRSSPRDHRALGRPRRLPGRPARRARRLVTGLAGSARLGSERSRFRRRTGAGRRVALLGVERAEDRPRAGDPTFNSRHARAIRKSPVWSNPRYGSTKRTRRAGGPRRRAPRDITSHSPRRSPWPRSPSSQRRSTRSSPLFSRAGAPPSSAAIPPLAVADAVDRRARRGVDLAKVERGAEPGMAADLPHPGPARSRLPSALARRGVVEDVAGHRGLLGVRSRRVDLAAGAGAPPAESGSASTAYSTRWQARRGCPRRGVPRRAPGPAKPAGEVDPLAGLLGARSGQQVVGFAVVPAAVETPHVAHDELGSS